MGDFDPLAGFYDLDYPDTSDHEFLKLVVVAVDPGRLLEVPCGSGRNVAPLLEAARGQAVFADLAESMVREAQAKIPVPDRGRARVVVADLRSLGSLGAFDLVICPREAFQLVAPADAGLALGSMAAALREGGLVVLDLYRFGPQAAVAADAPPDYFLAGQVSWATDWTRSTPDARLKVRRHRRQRLIGGGVRFELRYAVWDRDAEVTPDSAVPQILELDFDLANYSGAEIAALARDCGMAVLAALPGYSSVPSALRTVYVLGDERCQQSRERVHRIRAVVGGEVPASEPDRPDAG